MFDNCPDCGGVEYYIDEDGDIICRDCGTIFDEYDWEE